MNVLVGLPALVLVVLLSGLALVANSAALGPLLAISAPFEGGSIVGGGSIDAVRADIDAGDFHP